MLYGGHVVGCWVAILSNLSRFILYTEIGSIRCGGSNEVLQDSCILVWVGVLDFRI